MIDTRLTTCPSCAGITLEPIGPPMWVAANDGAVGSEVQRLLCPSCATVFTRAVTLTKSRIQWPGA